jgi:hypothetical protein
MVSGHKEGTKEDELTEIPPNTTGQDTQMLRRNSLSGAYQHKSLVGFSTFSSPIRRKLHKPGLSCSKNLLLGECKKTGAQACGGLAIELPDAHILPINKLVLGIHDVTPQFPILQSDESAQGFSYLLKKSHLFHSGLKHFKIYHGVSASETTQIINLSAYGLETFQEQWRVRLVEPALGRRLPQSLVYLKAEASSCKIASLSWLGRVTSAEIRISALLHALAEMTKQLFLCSCARSLRRVPKKVWQPVTA